MTAAAWPQGYCATKTLVQNFSSLTGFSVNSGGSAAISASHVKEGSDGILLTTRSGAFTELECTTDATSMLGRFTIRFYVEDYTKLTSIVLYLSTDDSYTSFVTYTYLFASSDHQFNGWHIIDFQDLVSDSSVSFTPSTFALNRTFARWKLRVTPVAGQVGSVWFDAFWTDAKPRTSVIITADDGYDSWFNDGVPILDAYDVKHTSAIIAPLVGTAGYVTTNQLATTYANGHEYCPHGETDLSLLGGYTAIAADIETNKAFLTNRGYTRASDFYIYPNGVFELSPGDLTILNAIKTNGIKCARNTYVPLYGINPNRRGIQTALLDSSENSLCSKYYPDFHRLSIIGYDGSADTPTIIANRIKTCIRFGTTAILMFHKVGSGGTAIEVSTSDLTAIIANLAWLRASGLIDIPRWSDWYTGLTQPALVP